MNLNLEIEQRYNCYNKLKIKFQACEQERMKLSEENKKLTKKDYFGMIREMVEGATVENKEELLAFVDKQVEMLDAKADKAKA